MDYVYLGVFLCALAFVLIVIFASVMLKRAANTMESLSHSLSVVEQKMNDITPELRQMLNETGHTVDDINEKLAVTDSLFAAFNDLGISLDEGNKYVNRQADKVMQESSPEKRNRLVDTVKWFNVAYKLYKRQK